MPAEAGQAQVRQPAWQVPEHGHAVLRQVHGPAQDDRGDHRDQQAGYLAVDHPGGQDYRDDPCRDRQIRGVPGGSARAISRSLGRVLGSVTVIPSMSGSCLAATWMPMPARNPTRTVRDRKFARKPEPGQPGQQQQDAREQGREPGQPDVLRRARDRMAGDGRAEDGSGGGVCADDKVTRRAKDGEGGHREQQRVQAGHHRHPGDLRVPRDTGMLTAARVIPASTSAVMWDRPAGSRPSSTGSVRILQRPRESGTVTSAAAAAGRRLRAGAASASSPFSHDGFTEHTFPGAARCPAPLPAKPVIRVIR